MNFVKTYFHNKRESYRQEGYARKHDVLYKRKGSEKVLFTIMGVIFLVFALSFIFPFLWVLINAFKDPTEYINNMTGLPEAWTFQNFIDAINFRDASVNYFNIFEMLGMSCIIAGAGTIVTVFTSSCAAYVLAKYKFPGRGLIWTVVIFSLIVPTVGSLPSQIELMQNMGLDGTIIGCIFIYSGGFGSNFLLLYSFFKSLSWTYVEAARIDGASDFRIFFQIIIPMAKGPMIAIAIIQLIGLWNDYLTPSIYLPDQPTIAVGLKNMTDKMQTEGNYTMLFATIILTLLPIIIVFMLFSKTIMENTSVGGLKG
ncbi:MAG: carbohydrate ABC transporter permease [Firmicutes bacterium]|uniref:Carbohydrate ABC transporter permease n=1 Tax=Candidatus Onthovivens merdipullorum TaxID=2840889 RepID=A0A9D9GWP3_9BACL|nr:carbohydrate ABC transporter permease [Candidatus Onthovivens merdipullorum]